MAALQKLGVPDKLVRAMERPATPLEDWTIEGVSGFAPGARAGWQHVLVNNKLFVYGGYEGEGKTRSFFDDVYMLDMSAKTWAQVFKSDIDQKVAATRHHCLVPGAKAPIIVALATPNRSDALEVVDVLDVNPMLHPNPHPHPPPNPNPGRRRARRQPDASP